MDNQNSDTLKLQALLADISKNAPAVSISRHLARVALYGFKNVESLHPDMQPLALDLVAHARANGLPITITNCYRTAAEQDRLYAQGRTAKGSIVTNAQGLQSYHNYGLAFDFSFENDPIFPPVSDPKWEQVGNIANSMGLIWGGQFGDVDHIEYHNGFGWQDVINYFKQHA